MEFINKKKLKDILFLTCINVHHFIKNNYLLIKLDLFFSRGSF